MPRKRPHANDRRGALSVEMAVVLIIFLLFLFGILEYCRYTYLRQIMQNAAREGARFAAVNSNDLSLVSDTQATVQTRLANSTSSMKNFTFQVYQADSSGNNVGAAASTPLGQRMAVQLDCDFTPILPTFLFMGANLHVTTKAFMTSEAN
jgi:Flp pilus assembly protein TadG